MKEFGLRITSPEEQRDVQERQKRFTTPEADGSAVVQQGGYYGFYMDMDGNIQNDGELILKYREMANQVELDRAIQDITNQAIVFDEEGDCVDLILDKLEMPESVKKAILEEFEKIMKLLDFKHKGYDIFRNWYVDGRIYYHCVIDHKRPNLGFQALDWIDPRKIKKIRQIEKTRDQQTGMDIIKNVVEFYVYNEAGVTNAQGTAVGLRIAPDSVVYVPSGLLNAKRTQVISYLHKAIKPFNQLKIAEDAMVLYRAVRAPERRLFYIDVGTMSTQKANQYVRSLQQNFRNKLVYDAETGEIRDDRKFMTMLEDFWLPRREGGRGTEISTLPGASNLGDIDDITYLRNKLYNALNIPVSRLQPENGFSLGRTTEITRDELAFDKFIKKIINQFSKLFDEILGRQLVLKGILTESEWNKIKQEIFYKFNEDVNFDQLKEAELLRDRLDILNIIMPHVGIFFSREWVKKNVLHQDEEEIKELQKQMDKEEEEFGPPAGMGGPEDEMMAGGMDAARKSRPAPTSPEGLAMVPPPSQEINVKIKNPQTQQ